MSETKHTQLPWEANQWRICAGVAPGQDIKVICDTANNKATRTPENMANAEFIVRAVNSHYQLLEACRKAVAHVEELRDAWMRGVIDERDSLGGTRSNRNAEVERELRAAIALASNPHAAERE